MGEFILNGIHYSGSSVIANPEDTPTETLTSISVNGVTYSLPSGGSNVIEAGAKVSISGNVEVTS